MFVTPDGMRTFRLPNRLSSMVEVSDRFPVKPLLRSVTFPQAAVVLALAQGSVRPLEIANDVPPSEIDIADLPSDVATAVGKSSIGDRTAAGLPLILACAEPLDSGEVGDAASVRGAPVEPVADLVQLGGVQLVQDRARGAGKLGRRCRGRGDVRCR